MLPNLSGLFDRNAVRTGAGDDDNSFEALVEHLKEHYGKWTIQVFRSSDGTYFRGRMVSHAEWKRAMRMAGKAEAGDELDDDAAAEAEAAAAAAEAAAEAAAAASRAAEQAAWAAAAEAEEEAEIAEYSAAHAGSDNSFEALVEHIKEHYGKWTIEVFRSSLGTYFRGRKVSHDEWKRAMKMAGKKEAGDEPDDAGEDAGAVVAPRSLEEEDPRARGYMPSLAEAEEEEERRKYRRYMPSLAEMEERNEQPKYR